MSTSEKENINSTNAEISILRNNNSNNCDFSPFQKRSAFKRTVSLNLQKIPTDENADFIGDIQDIKEIKSLLSNISISTYKTASSESEEILMILKNKRKLRISSSCILSQNSGYMLRSQKGHTCVSKMKSNPEIVPERVANPIYKNLEKSPN